MHLHQVKSDLGKEQVMHSKLQELALQGIAVLQTIPGEEGDLKVFLESGTTSVVSLAKRNDWKSDVGLALNSGVVYSEADGYESIFKCDIMTDTLIGRLRKVK
jgi:hypothetical protein